MQSWGPSGKPETDQSEIGVYFAKGPVEKTVFSVPMMHRDLTIPAGDSHYQVTSTFVTPIDLEVIGIAPHMHLLGQDMIPRSVRRQKMTIPRNPYSHLVRLSQYGHLSGAGRDAHGGRRGERSMYVAGSGLCLLRRNVWCEWHPSFRERDHEGVLPVRYWQFANSEFDRGMGQLCLGGLARIRRIHAGESPRIIRVSCSRRIAYGPVPCGGTRIR